MFGLSIVRTRRYRKLETDVRHLRAHNQLLTAANHRVQRGMSDAEQRADDRLRQLHAVQDELSRVPADLRARVMNRMNDAAAASTETEGEA